MSDAIIDHSENRILRLTIHRPERKNALNLAMYQSLADHINNAMSNGHRVIVLTGSEGCFTSGNDLADFFNTSVVLDYDHPVAHFIEALFRCPIPIVVAVEGVAVGIGTTLLLHSDLIYAHPEASFRLPFVNLGLCPEFGSSIVLPRFAGHAKAAEWLMLGDFFSAQDALQVGLINGIEDDPLAKAMAQAQRLTEQAPAALRSAKALMKAPEKANIEAVIQNEFAVFNAALKSSEFAEAATAFFEKRQPNFSSFE